MVTFKVENKEELYDSFAAAAECHVSDSTHCVLFILRVSVVTNDSAGYVSVPREYKKSLQS